MYIRAGDGALLKQVAEGPEIFEFSTSRGRDGPRQLLRNLAGLPQHDDCAGYNGVGGDGAVHLGCRARARLVKLRAWPINRVAELTPMAWKARRVGA